MNSRLRRSSPQDQNLSEDAILNLIESLESSDLDIHSLMIVRHGHVVAEGWWKPYQSDENHLLYSLTKSFMSTTVGLAVAEGLFSLDDLIVDLFKAFLPDEVSENLSQMKVRHLLSMCVGHETEPRIGLNESSWEESAKVFLAHEVARVPGNFFMYNTAASNMLSILIQMKSGELLSQFARPRLLKPLGIENEDWTNWTGFDWGGSGLYTTTESIAKLGLLYLNDGKWEGKQLLPEGWVETATKSHISNGDDPNNDWNQGYGFQFWRCRHGAFRGDGAFGQYCVVMPAQDAVVAITSSIGDMQKVLDLIWTILLPAFDQESNEPSGKLKEKLSSLTMGPNQPAPAPISIENDAESFALNIDDRKANLKLFEDLEFSLDGWQRIHYKFGGDKPKTAGINILQTAPDEILIKICDVNSPQIQTIKVKVANGTAEVSFADNGTFFPVSAKTFTATVLNG